MHQVVDHQAKADTLAEQIAALQRRLAKGQKALADMQLQLAKHRAALVAMEERAAERRARVAAAHQPRQHRPKRDREDIRSLMHQTHGVGL